MQLRYDSPSNILIMEQFFTISKEGIEAVLCYPSSKYGYYRGTRFDWSGVFRKITRRGHIYADTWFDGNDPVRHDNVCGPSEEFVIFRNDLPGTFLKIGVGLLKKESGPYDRFKYYEIVDEGIRSLEALESLAVFRHCMQGQYEYEKRVEIIDGNVMEIRHCLMNLSSSVLDTYVYNHNFFNLDNAAVGPAIKVDFPYEPEGTWRELLPEVAIKGESIVFSSELKKGGKTPFIGDLSSCKDFSFRIGNLASGIAVEASVDLPVEYSVFWANSRVCCVEPYVHLTVETGSSISWTNRYIFS